VKKLVIAVIALTGAYVASAAAQNAPVPINQLNMDAVPHIDRDGVRRVQTLLKQKGFDPGPLDGTDGPLTTTAVRGFQTRYGMKSVGAIDNQTLFALGAVNLAGNAAPGDTVTGCDRKKVELAAPKSYEECMANGKALNCPEDVNSQFCRQYFPK